MSEQITPQDVLDKIEAFCQEHETEYIMPGYEFEHIVLGDYNLLDGSIRFVLNEKDVDDWKREKIQDAERARYYPGGDEVYQKQDILAMTKALDAYAKEATEFLNWLLSVPESVRIDAEWLEHGEIL